MALSVFPALTLVEWPVIKTPDWSNTDIQRSVTGKRTTLARQSYPIYRFELSHSLRSDAANLELQTLMAFYNSVNGPANLFQFNDVNDTAVTTQAFGTGDGATVAFQLVRAMAGIGASWVDPVFGPTGAPQIFDNGALKATPADYAIGATGLVTFVAPPVLGHVLTWTGTFNWLCRFDDSTASFEQFMAQFWQQKSIKFSSEKL